MTLRTAVCSLGLVAAVGCSPSTPMPDAGGPEGCLPLPMDGGTSHPSSINADENWTETMIAWDIAVIPTMTRKIP